MGLESNAGGSESRFVAYVEAIARALGHADRATPFQSYRAGLLLPGDRKRDYQDLKQELGLGQYEGRGWRGFHHHATLCVAALSTRGSPDQP